MGGESRSQFKGGLEMDYIGNLLDYRYHYDEAVAEHDRLQSRLEEMPFWLIEEEIGLTNEEPILELLEQEGIQDVDQTNGRPLTMLEWLVDGCYSVYTNDNQEMINNYFEYLENYKMDINLIRANIDWDYMQEPFAVHQTDILGKPVYAYKIIRGEVDFIAIGFEFSSSELFEIEWDTPFPHLVVGEATLFIHDFIKIREDWL